MGGTLIERSPLHERASALSKGSQKKHFGLIFFTVALSVIAAIISALRPARWSGLVVAVLFVVEVVAFSSERFALDKRWFDGRAVAESAKTIMWRYVAGASPFPKSIPPEEVRRRAEGRAAEVSRNLPPALTADLDQSSLVPASWDGLRESSLEERHRLYAEGRLQPQISWYQDKSELNKKRDKVMRALLVLVSLVGIAGGIAMATGWTRADVVGVAAALFGAVLAFSQAKQYSMLAKAYEVTAKELGMIATTLPEQVTEDSWAVWVDQVEGAISREHTMWLASTGKLPELASMSLTRMGIRL